MSVLVPVFNGERYLAQCLDGLLPQLASGDECIIQDGGSTDATLDIIKDYAGRYPLMSCVSEPDEGQTDALNRALSRATGDYVGWVNADDLVSAGAVARVKAEVDRTGRPDVAYGDYQVVNHAGKVIRTLTPSPPDLDRLLTHGCYLFSGATYFSRSTLVRAGLDSRLHYCMDFDLFLRMCADPDLTTAHVPAVLGSFRLHANSKTGSVGRKFVREAYEIRKATVGRITRSDHQGMVWRFNRIYRPTGKHFVAMAATSLRYTDLYGRLRGAHHGVGG